MSRTVRTLAVIGAGRIGTPIGTHWIRAGHTVAFASRTPERLDALAVELGPLARAVGWREAAASAEAVLIAVPYPALADVIAETGPLLNGKIVIDATNPAALSPDGRIVSSLGPDLTAGSRTAQLLPQAKVVRAFSHILDELLLTRAFRKPLPAAMAYAGDDDHAKAVVAALIADSGFAPLDLGTLATSSALDPGGALFAGLYTETDARIRVAAGLAESR